MKKHYASEKEAGKPNWRLKITVKGTTRKAVIGGLWDAAIELYKGKLSGAESGDDAAYIFKLEAE